MTANTYLVLPILSFTCTLLNFRPYPQTCKHLCYQSLDPSKKCYCKLGFDGYCCGHYQVCCTCNEFYECNEKNQACGKLVQSFCYPKSKIRKSIQNLWHSGREYLMSFYLKVKLLV